MTASASLRHTSRLDDGLPWRPAYWAAGFVLVAVLHIGLVWIALHWIQVARPSAAPPAATMIDLAPMPAAAPMQSVAEPARMQAPSQPPPPEPPPPEPPQPEPLPFEPPLPEPAVAKPMPQVAPSPAPEIAVPVPPAPKPRPKPVERQRRMAPARVPDATPPLANTAVPTRAETPPSPAAAAPSVAASGASSAVPNWQGLLAARLAQFKRYPVASQARHEQGVAYLRFAMDRQGTVLAASLERTSGYDLLDQEVLALIHRAEPLPRPPPEVSGQRIELVVPIRFFLRDRR